MKRNTGLKWVKDQVINGPICKITPNDIMSANFSLLPSILVTVHKIQMTKKIKMEITLILKKKKT